MASTYAIQHNGRVRKCLLETARFNVDLLKRLACSLSVQQTWWHANVEPSRAFRALVGQCGQAHSDSTYNRVALRQREARFRIPIRSTRCNKDVGVTWHNHGVATTEGVVSKSPIPKAATLKPVAAVRESLSHRGLQRKSKRRQANVHHGLQALAKRVTCDRKAVPCCARPAPVHSAP